MSKVSTHMTMSLDGYIATADDAVDELFDWYMAGDNVVETANPDIGMRVDDVSATFLTELTGSVGALICGRHLFDVANGWGGTHPVGAPVVVVTHRPPDDAETAWPTTTFVHDVASAVERAKEIAGDRDVTIASPTIIQQALDLGLVDEVCVSLVPVLFGGGKSYFGALADGHVLLDDPDVVVGRRATHLRYRVAK
ncbi:deaminase [Gordonia sp. TBRC 11910]|uniref:Deaminase n=1 Tax=Gordonia asplenii TaxID=2725283 RepID=A0A848KX51_9ACTN|nr:dihydrofolate reductase family protein [Gordonia asplenii]NMO02822.1 deaminase [Gordonia asplenii]